MKENVSVCFFWTQCSSLNLTSPVDRLLNRLQCHDRLVIFYCYSRQCYTRHALTHTKYTCERNGSAGKTGKEVAQQGIRSSVTCIEHRLLELVLSSLYCCVPSISQFTDKNFSNLPLYSETISETCDTDVIRRNIHMYLSSVVRWTLFNRVERHSVGEECGRGGWESWSKEKI